MEIGLILVVAVFVFAVGIIMIFNGLVKKRNETEAAWSNIDVHMQKRFDVVPNLVATVKGYADHEKETLERVIALRNACMNTDSPEELGKLEGKMAGALKSVFALAEAYPDLKANQNFLVLQEQLMGLEDKIGYARINYNNAARIFNTSLQSFPGMLFSGKFVAKELFEVDAPEVKKAVKVEF